MDFIFDIYSWALLSIFFIVGVSFVWKAKWWQKYFAAQERVNLEFWSTVPGVGWLGKLLSNFFQNGRGVYFIRGFGIFWILLIVLMMVVMVVIPQDAPEADSVFCTQEAKQCPDGSYVGRVGPRCEFATCPGGDGSEEENWKTFSDPESGVSFRYPETFGTTYIHPVDWPPRVAIVSEPFRCTEAGSAIDRAGKTSERVVNGRTYCVTEKTEGAAGSIYTLYAFAAPADGKTVVYTFSTRAVQCANYDNPQQAACLQERERFAVDAIVDSIVRGATIP